MDVLPTDFGKQIIWSVQYPTLTQKTENRTTFKQILAKNTSILLKPGPGWPPFHGGTFRVIGLQCCSENA